MFAPRSAAVVGMGKSGSAATALLKSKGCVVVELDEKNGPLPELISGVEVVVLSPGVPRKKVRAGCPIIGEIELAYRMLPQGAGPIMAVTGTNGKSTTTALLGELIPNSFVGGNLGRPFSEACSKAWPCHVLELSSYQLESIEDTVVLGSIFLNLTPDHMDRYSSLEEYGKAKARIFRNAPKGGFVIANADDERVTALCAEAKVPVYGFTTDLKKAAKGLAGMAVASASGRFSFNFGAREELAVRNIALRGAHNLQNAMAAALAARLYGFEASQIQKVLDSFKGLPHRLERVGLVNGVEWVNDSKATNVDSSIKALDALQRPIWLIAGGKGKGAPYAPLVQAAKGKVRGVLTIGEDAQSIEAAFTAQHIDVYPVETLSTAVERARQLAQSGDVVLLSPACASFDQFNNFEHRGEEFKKLVMAQESLT